MRKVIGIFVIAMGVMLPPLLTRMNSDIGLCLAFPIGLVCGWLGCEIGWG